MTDSHRDTSLVEQLAHVVRVDALECERDRPAAVLAGRRPDDAQPIDPVQGIEGVRRQLVLVLPDVVHAEVGEVVDCCADADRLRDRRRARLELVG